MFVPIASGPSALSISAGQILDDSGQLFQPEILRNHPEHINVGSSTSKLYADATVRHVSGELVAALDTVRFQTAGSAAAMQLAAAAMADVYPGQNLVLAIDNGWGRHDSIFDQYDIRNYRRVDPETQIYDHDAYISQIEQLDPGSMLLLQASGYNPDGIDRTAEQWNDIVVVADKQNLLAIVDCAYDGLVNENRADDVFIINELIKAGVRTIVSYSHTKTMGTMVDGEHLGTLIGYNMTQEEARVLQLASEQLHISGTNLTAAAKVLSVIGDQNSPTYLVIGDQLSTIKTTISSRRDNLVDQLGTDFDYLRKTKGIFSLFRPEGFSDRQRAFLSNRHGMNADSNGRLSYGAVPIGRIPDLARALIKIDDKA